MSQDAYEAPETTTPTQATTEGGKVLSQQAIYSKIAIHTDKILTTIINLLDSRNEAIALGAAKILANKIIPDLRTTQITGENGEAIKLNIISGADYVSALGKLTTASDTSPINGSTEVQSTD